MSSRHFVWRGKGKPCNTSISRQHKTRQLQSTNEARFLLPWRNSPSGPRPPHCRGFMITLKHTTLGRTPLGEWSARRRDLFLTTHNTHKRQTPMPPAGFEPTILASERPQTHTLGRAEWGELQSEKNSFFVVCMGFPPTNQCHQNTQTTTHLRLKAESNQILRQ
jgi:hypothetical protein